MSKYFIAALFCLTGWLTMSGQTCNWEDRISSIKEQIQHIQPDGEKLLLYRDLAFAYYENEQFNLCENVFAIGDSLLEKADIADTTKWYYTLDRANALDTPLDRDSLNTLIQNQLSKEHSLIDMITVQKSYTQIINNDAEYNDSLLSLVTKRLKANSTKSHYGIIGDDYRSIYFHRANDLSSAISILQKNIDYIKRNHVDCSKQLIRSTLRLGRRFLDQGKLDTALVNLLDAESWIVQYYPLSKNQLVETRLLIAQAYIDNRKYDLASPVLKLLENGCSTDTSLYASLPTVYNLWGQYYSRQLKNDQAIYYAKKHIQALETTYPEGTTKVFAAYHNIGVRFMNYGEYTTAGIYLNKAVDLCTKLFGEIHSYTAIATLTLGTYYERIGNTPQAIELTNRSLEQRKQLYGYLNPRSASALINLSIAYRNIGDYPEAHKYVDQVLAIASTLNDQKLLQKGQITKSQIYNYERRYDLALDWIQKAKLQFSPDIQIETLNDPTTYLSILQEEILNRFGLSINSTQLSPDITYSGDEGIEIFNWLVSSTKSNADKINLFTEYRRLIEYTAGLYLKRYQIESKSTDLQRALQLADLVKSNINVLNKSLVNSFHENDSLSNHLSTLGTQLTQSKIKQLRLISTGNIQEAQKWNTQILTIEDELNKIYSNTGQFTKRLPKWSIDQLDEFDKTKTYLQLTLLEEAILGFKINGAMVEGQLFTINDSLFNTLKNWNETKFDPQSNIHNNKEINALFSKILLWSNSENNSLVIVADKELSTISFDLIRVNNSYAIENYSISYEGSFYDLNQRTSAQAPTTFVGFAPKYLPHKTKPNEADYMVAMTRAGQFDLPFAKKEVKSIQKRVHGNIFTDTQANKENFFKSLKASNIIHLSMHAIVDDHNPLDSRLLFNTKDGAIDNLYLHELAFEETNTQMIVLSACRTGRGMFHSSEGSKSFSNVFLQLGVPSVVLSKWEVPDEQTATIMTDFYTQLKEGLAKDKALQIAKINHLKNASSEKLLHPYYWAGMVITGSTTPMTFQKSNANSWWLIVVGLILLIAGVSYKKYVSNALAI